MFVIQTWPELGNTRRTHKYTRNSQGILKTKEDLIIFFFLIYIQPFSIVLILEGGKGRQTFIFLLSNLVKSKLVTI